MADFNKVMLIGRLTRDPQLRYLPNQNAVCDFGFATGRKYKMANGEEREESTFVDCTLFGKGAEIFNQYCQKGKQVFLEGRLKFDTWDDKQTGQKRNKLTVVVENFQFLGGREGAGAPGGGDEAGAGGGGGGERSYGSRPGGFGGGGSGGGSGSRRPTGTGGRPAPQAQPDADPPFNDEQQFKDDDIPF